MIKSGIRPIKKDHRLFSFHRTFQPMHFSYGPVVGDTSTDFNFDAQLSNPNQNALGFPEGCSSFTQSEIGQDEDKRIYDFRYTYDRTLEIEGISTTDPLFEKVGCVITDSLKSTIVYGLQSNDGADPLTHRRGAYYDALDNDKNLDAFDAAILCMKSNSGSLSVGTQWLPEWLATGFDGIITSVFIPRTTAPWHNFKVCGVKTSEGVQYLIAKPWIGPLWGDKGFCYFSRDVFNKAMKIKGSGAFALAPYSGQIETVKLNVLQVILSYLRMWSIIS